MSYDRPILRSNRQVDVLAAIGQLVFTFPLPLFDIADLAVLIQAAPSLLFQPIVTGFTVALSADLSQGTVTFAAAPRTLQGQAIVVRLQGRRVQDRLSSVTRGGTIVSKSLEDELDRESLILQELRRDIDAAVLQAGQALALATTQILPTTVSLWQIRMALAARGEAARFEQIVSAVPIGDLTAVAYTSRGLFAINDPFLAQIAVTLGDTPADTAARLSLAATFIELPGPNVAAYWTVLANAGLFVAVEQTIPADPADPLNIAWSSGTVVSPIGLVAAAVAKVAGASVFAALPLSAPLALPGPALSMRQLRATLGIFGVLGQADASFAAFPGSLLTIVWKGQSSVALSDPILTSLAAAIAFTPQQMAALLFYAGGVVFS